MLSRESIGKAAKELADHLQLVENVKALQTAQKEMADAIKNLAFQIQDLRSDLKVLKAETRADALKETQTIVNGVQGGLNQRLEDLAVKVAVLGMRDSTDTVEMIRTPRPGSTGLQIATRDEGSA